jgi:hypothetical protein
VGIPRERGKVEMHIRFNLGDIHIYIGISRQVKVEGICSRLKDSDKHILMWDFDDTMLDHVEQALRQVQRLYALPNIYIVNTGIEGYYHAYCFQAHTWHETIAILSQTPHLDEVYFKIGVVRGYFTLRVSAKKDRQFKLVKTLESDDIANVEPFKDLAFGITYETKRG